MYQPPNFDPIHFDDGALPTHGRHPVRWISGSQGDPAEQVTLGWGLDETTLVVVATCTVARLPDKADRRQDCVFQALGGYRLGPVPLTARERHQAIERAQNMADFAPIELTADGAVCTGAVSTVHHFLVGHARVGTRVVTFAARGLDIDRIRLRTLDSAGGYAIDPRAAQTIADIDDNHPPFVVP